MKKILLIALLTVTVALPATQAAVTTVEPLTKEKVATMTESEKKARFEEIKQRVYEIKAMDKSSLTKTERKELRHELKDLKKQAKAVQGIYLSVGAVIIIILLLILIL
jgi:DNA gyrase/topoisomerase IV subunit A